MKDREPIRTTFAQDTRMTPGIISIIAKIADNSITTYKQRKDSNRKYYVTVPKVTKQEDEGKMK